MNSANVSTRNTRRSKWLAGVALVALWAVGSTGFAQGTPAQDELPPLGVKPADAPPPAETPPPAQPASAVNQPQQAQSYMAQMRSTLVRVERLADAALAARDIIKHNCINDKLVEIKGVMKVAESSAKRLDDHEFAKITIAYQRVTVLGQEADACAGEEISYVGQTRVTVDVDPELEQVGDPTEQLDKPMQWARPPLASPTT